MSAQVVAGKVCCRCGRNVAGSPRMKDSEGRYWCVPCAELDERNRFQASAGICTGCGEAVGRPQLVEIAGEHLCKWCRKRKFSGGNGFSSSGLLASIKSLFGR